MINTYTNQENPCGFCIEQTDDSNVAKKEDVLEIALGGNDTKLYVRETSVTGCGVQRKKTVDFESIHQTVEDVSIVPSTAVESKSDKGFVSVKPTNEVKGNKDLQSLYTMVWSGDTYFEEELRKIRRKVYKNEVCEALKKRRLWKQFQRELKKDKIRDLIRSSGPEWWQEPSLKQVSLALGLEDIIIADHEEGVTGRTRQWLLDLGVTTRFTAQEVRKCMRMSLLNPIDFLLEAHAVILKSQLNVKKTRGNLERPFSINERIILSALCVLQLPTLLTILHYVFPPAKVFSDSEHVQRLLYGDIDDDSIRYCTPYMEPLPFRSKRKFQEWTFDKVFMALLPSLLPDEFKVVRRTKVSIRVTRSSVNSLKSSLARQSAVGLSEIKRPERLQSLTEQRPSSVMLLVSHCVARRTIVPDPRVTEDSYDIEQSRIFSRNLTKIDWSKVSSSLPKDSGASTSLGTANNFPSQTGLRDSGRHQTDTIQSVNTFDPSRSGSVYPLSTNDYSSTKEHPSIESPRKKIGTETFGVSLKSPSFMEKEKTRSKSRKSSLKLVINGEGKATDGIFENEDQNEIKFNLPPESVELQNLWNEIRNLPEDKQLRHTLKVLAGMGDPLAQLPRIDRIPAVNRWLELRKGRNRILSKETKEALLSSSRGMWQSAPVSWSTDIPKVKCSKRKERSLTWNKKQWLQSEVKKEVEKFTSKVRQEKVENARSYFPTMLNHYDHGSKLNRNFREVYFTYLPPREADTFVYRPWKPSDSRQ